MKLCIYDLQTKLNKFVKQLSQIQNRLAVTANQTLRQNSQTGSKPVLSHSLTLLVKLYLIICILSWSWYAVLYKTDNISIILNHHVDLSYFMQSEHTSFISILVVLNSAQGRHCTRVATSGTGLDASWTPSRTHACLHCVSVRDKPCVERLPLSKSYLAWDDRTTKDLSSFSSLPLQKVIR